MRGGRKLAALSLGLAVLAACASNETLTEIVVSVDTDMAVPQQVDEIAISVTGSSGETQTASARVADPGATTLPVSLSLSPDGDANAVSLTMTARFGGDAVVTRDVRTRFVAGERRLLAVTLARACLPVSCAQGQTCVDGQCAGVDVAESALPPWTGALPKRLEAAPGGAAVTALAPGESHSCVVTTTHRVLCWGNNDDGELASPAQVQRLAPALVKGVDDVVELGASVDYSCARQDSGAVMCWGANDDGQLGSGQAGGDFSTPVAVVGLPPVVHVATGEGHACALDKDGNVWCWGHNDHGQLGDGTMNDSAKPIRVPLAAVAKEVSVGEDHTCAMLETGAVECWGANEFGALGDGVTDGKDNPVPQMVKNLTDAKSIRCGSYHACAVRAQRVVSCWGRNNRGQLGDGHASGDLSTMPVEVGGISDTRDIVAGEFHTCARSESGIVTCWGGNEFGQLGDGTTMDRASPVPVQLGDAASMDELAAGSFHACARKSLGAVWCWGANEKGQLGDGTAENRPRPVVVIGLP